jgi:hypothetical protein
MLNEELADEDIDPDAIKELTPRSKAERLSKVEDFMKNNMK